MEQQVSITRNVAFRELEPTIHWAQQHTREFGNRWSRRIYDFQLLHVVRGQLRVTLGEHSFHLEGGQSCLIPPMLWHTVEVVSEPNAILLGIHFDFFGEITVAHDSDIIVEEPLKEGRRFCAMPIVQDMPFMHLPPDGLTVQPRIVRLMEEAISEWNERFPGYQMACRGILLQLFAQLSRSLAEPSHASVHPKYDAGLMRLTRELEENSSLPWTLSDMAAYLSTHEDYFSRLFKARMGTSPNKYLQSIRHKQAKRLLRESALSIQEVAEASGYDDMHYFSRIFRKWEGMSPLQFRRMSQRL